MSPVPKLETARVEWVGPVEVPVESDVPAAQVSLKERIRCFLREAVFPGWENRVPSEEAYRQSIRKVGEEFSQDTFERAARAAGLRSKKSGPVWFWWLPEDASRP